MCSTKSVDLIGHIKLVLWGQLDGYRVTRTFLSVKGVACKTNQLLWCKFPKSNYVMWKPSIYTTVEISP